MRASLLIALVILVPAPTDAEGQRRMTIGASHGASASELTASFLARDTVRVAPRDMDFVAMTMSGLALGALGTIAGGYAGIGAECLVSPGEWCGFVGAVFGAVVVESILLPTGVWLVHRQGSPWKTIGTGAGIGLLGIAVTIATSSAFPANLLAIPAIPIVQLPVALVMEHRAAVRSARR